MNIAHALAIVTTAIRNCEESGNLDWLTIWHDRLEAIEDELPSGSGFNNGTKVESDYCNASVLRLKTAFHHMNDAGYYDGWTHHNVTVRPSFIGSFDVQVSGRDRNQIKEYIASCFHETLSREWKFAPVQESSDAA